MNETWKDIPGWEGFYQASDLGRIRSVPRLVPYSDGRVALRPGKVMSPRPDGNGYPAVNLSRNNTRTAQCVYVLVARAFLGPTPEGQEVRHWDDNKTNNVLSNLVHGTRSDNARDSVRNGTHSQARKTHCSNDHPLAGDNVRTTTKDGRIRRFCRTCGRAATARYDRNKNSRGYSLAA